MAKKKKNVTITVTVKDAEILVQAIQDRIVDLEKVGSSLLKQKLGDAAKVVFDNIKNLQSIQAKLQSDEAKEDAAAKDAEQDDVASDESADEEQEGDEDEE